jgi:hypothetical protein
MRFFRRTPKQNPNGNKEGRAAMTTTLRNIATTIGLTAVLGTAATLFTPTESTAKIGRVGGGANLPGASAPGARMETHLNIPSSVQHTLRKACQDCHSNETRWPWYSRVAPASWLVKRDVEHGRRAMNFSEWSQQTGNRAGRVAGLLTAACADVQSGRMPMPQYRLIHREANLSSAEKADFCAWTAAESRNVLNASRKAATSLSQLVIHP